eukprot:7002852-Prymnesium_polylepis.1
MPSDRPLALLAVAPCNAPPLLERRHCLYIDVPFYLAFVGATCYALPDRPRPTADCLEPGGYSAFADYFASEGGFVLSAALRGDAAGLGHP